MITDHDINSKKGLSSLHKINLEIKINKSILIFSIPESPSIPKIWSPLQCKNIVIPFYNIVWFSAHNKPASKRFLRLKVSSTSLKVFFTTF